MYSISQATYSLMAQQLRDDIADLNYYSGTIDSSLYDDDGLFIEYKFIASLIIYRTPYSSPEGNVDLISNIVPVWHECKIFVDGEEQIHNFDLDELKLFVCVWE